MEFEISVANIFHVNGLANWVKRVLKTRVSIESRVFETRDTIIINSFKTGQLTIESRVFETRDTIIINSFKTGQLTILVDTHCYLARGFL